MFATEFSTLCEILGYPLDTRMEDFWLKIKPTIQSTLALLSASANFDELVEHVIRLYHVQYSLWKSLENTNPHSNVLSHNNKLFCEVDGQNDGN